MFKRIKSRKCIICGCGRTEGISIFRFPSNEKRCKEWIDLKFPELSSLTMKQLQCRYICSRHFEESNFTSTLRCRLSKFAVPTLNFKSTESEKKVQITVGQFKPDILSSNINYLKQENYSLSGYHEKLYNRIKFPSDHCYARALDPVIPKKSEIIQELEHSYSGTEGSKHLSCSAIGCSNSKQKTPELTFFSFPQDSERSKCWIINSRREDLLQENAEYLNRSCVMCSLHFEDNQFINNLKNELIHNAVPTIFVDPNSSNLLESNSYSIVLELSKLHRNAEKEERKFSLTDVEDDQEEQFTVNTDDRKSEKSVENEPDWDSLRCEVISQNIKVECEEYNAVTVEQMDSIDSPISITKPDPNSLLNFTDIGTSNLPDLQVEPERFPNSEYSNSNAAINLANEQNSVNLVSHSKAEVPNVGCKRRRQPHYTKRDLKYLSELVNKFKDSIECRESDSANIMRKQMAWKIITYEFNQIPGIYRRTLKQLKTCWKNLKWKMKKSTTLIESLQLCESRDDVTPRTQHLRGLLNPELPSVEENNNEIIVPVDPIIAEITTAEKGTQTLASNETVETIERNLLLHTVEQVQNQTKQKNSAEEIQRITVEDYYKERMRLMLFEHNEQLKNMQEEQQWKRQCHQLKIDTMKEERDLKRKYLQLQISELEAKNVDYYSC